MLRPWPTCYATKNPAVTGTISCIIRDYCVSLQPSKTKSAVGRFFQSFYMSYTLFELSTKSREELEAIAAEYALSNVKKLDNENLAYAILDAQAKARRSRRRQRRTVPRQTGPRAISKKPTSSRPINLRQRPPKPKRPRRQLPSSRLQKPRRRPNVAVPERMPNPSNRRPRNPSSRSCSTI